MAKNKANAQRKKRSKAYSGSDAKARSDNVTRIKAVQRGKIGGWFDENRRRLAGWGVVIGLGLIFYFLISLLLRVIF